MLVIYGCFSRATCCLHTALSGDFSGLCKYLFVFVKSAFGYLSSLPRRQKHSVCSAVLFAGATLRLGQKMVESAIEISVTAPPPPQGLSVWLAHFFIFWTVGDHLKLPRAVEGIYILRGWTCTNRGVNTRKG